VHFPSLLPTLRLRRAVAVHLAASAAAAAAALSVYGAAASRVATAVADVARVVVVWDAPRAPVLCPL